MALPHPRLIAAGVALVLAFGTGWAAQGWRMGACHENEKWVYGTINKVKTVLPGLLTRRGANSDLCANGL